MRQKKSKKQKEHTPCTHLPGGSYLVQQAPGGSYMVRQAPTSIITLPNLL